MFKAIIHKISEIFNECVARGELEMAKKKNKRYPAPFRVREPFPTRKEG